MDSAKNQLADKLKTANNILVTVSRDPSVDQLAALLGLSLALNKAGKHAAAVFSGEVPSTLEFLQPEETIEKNTDSLRDFIIALDKAKADKLRYKVEDDVVRIFITPYKTSISQEDLEFSQGDFNVDVVVAIGVEQQEDLDEAITAHGRILHDATVTSITVQNGQNQSLGSLNWHDDHASSLSELVTELVEAIDKELMDGQIATALLTGIVAETDRFSNEKTTSQTMSMSALLMAAGANQQLVATKLNEPTEPAAEDAPSADTNDEDDQDHPDVAPDDNSDEPPKPNDGSLEIDHEHDSKPEPEPESEPAIELPTPEPEETPEESSAESPEIGVSNGSRLIVDPPTLGGQLTANSQVEALDPANDSFGAEPVNQDQMLTRDTQPVTSPKPAEAEQSPEPEALPEPVEPAPVASEPAPVLTPPPVDWSAPPTLTELEASVVTHPADEPAAPSSGLPAETDQPADLDDARDEVSRALSSGVVDQPLGPTQALNAQPLGENLHPFDAPMAPEMEAPAQQASGYTSVEDLLKQSSDVPTPAPLPSVPIPDDVVVQQTPAEPVQVEPKVTDPNAPPPVPPPIPFQFGQAQPGQNPLNPPQ